MRFDALAAMLTSRESCTIQVRLPESSKWLVRHLSGVCLAEEPQAELYNKSYSVHCGPILSKINKKKKKKKVFLVLRDSNLR